MRAALTRAWRRHVTAHLDAADAEGLSFTPRTTDGGAPVAARDKSLWVFVIGSLVLTAMSYGVLNHGSQQAMAETLIDVAGGLSASLGELLGRYRDLLRMAMWTLGAFVMYVVVPGLVIRVIFRERLSDFGLNARGFVRHLPVYALLFVPVAALVLIVAAQPDFQSKYPFYKTPQGWTDFLIWEALYMLQFFSLEFFFRGFLVHGLKQRLGSLAAFAMVAPYVMIHFSKPLYETLGAVIAGSVLGVLSLRTGSIAGGVLIHCAVAVMMDVAALAHRGFPW